MVPSSSSRLLAIFPSFVASLCRFSHRRLIHWPGCVSLSHHRYSYFLVGFILGVTSSLSGFRSSDIAVKIYHRLHIFNACIFRPSSSFLDALLDSTLAGFPLLHNVIVIDVFCFHQQFISLLVVVSCQLSSNLDTHRARHFLLLRPMALICIYAHILTFFRRH